MTVSFGINQRVTSSAVHRYAPSAFYNLQTHHVLNWRARMMSTTANCEIPIVGPSTARGQSDVGSAQAVNSWPMQAARFLQAMGINAGANNFFGNTFGWGAGNTVAQFIAGDARITASGGASIAAINTAGGNAFNFTNDVAGQWNFTGQDQVTKADIYWTNSGTAGRTFGWGVDGGALTNIATTGSGLAARSTVDLGAKGSHALNLARVTNSSTILGVNAYDDSNGRREISLLNMGISGATSARLADLSGGQVDMLRVIALIAPPVVILDDLFINDWRTSVPLATSQANASTIITYLQTRDILPIMTTCLPDGSATNNAPQQQSYSDLAFSLADTYDFPVWDWRSAMVNYTAGNAIGAYVDTVHQKPLGSAMKAAGFAELVRTVRAR